VTTALAALAGWALLVGIIALLVFK